MKFVIGVVIALLLHPVAVILTWISLARRRDLTRRKKLVWAVVCLIWGIGPILYMLLEDGSLW